MNAKYKVDGHPLDPHDLSGVWGFAGVAGAEPEVAAVVGIDRDILRPARDVRAGHELPRAARSEERRGRLHQVPRRYRPLRPRRSRRVHRLLRRDRWLPPSSLAPLARTTTALGHPGTPLFTGRLFFLGGSSDLQELHTGPRVRAGDLSGITTIEASQLLRPFVYPPPEVEKRLFVTTTKDQALLREVNRQWTRVLTGQ